MEPIFIETGDAYAIHDFSIEEYGGAHGVRDPGAFDGALQAPRNYWNYSDLELDSETLGTLAAIYWFHVSGNHPFIDGNKRTAFLGAKSFLNINGLDLDIENNQIIELGLSVASGKLSRDELISAVLPFVVELDG